MARNTILPLIVLDSYCIIINIIFRIADTLEEMIKFNSRKALLLYCSVLSQCVRARGMEACGIDVVIVGAACGVRNSMVLR